MNIKRLTPPQAIADLDAHEHALLIDVRDPVEFAFVGHPLSAVNIPWKFAPDMRANPDFIAQVSEIAPSHDTPLYLMCRSGQRSMAAATALSEAGYTRLINIEEGFEGDMDDNRHRSTRNGWRFHGLPWVQS